MDIEGEEFFITPDELAAGSLSNPCTEWNDACTPRNFVFRIHNGTWHFRLHISHLAGYKDSLERTVALPALDEKSPSYYNYVRLTKGQKVASELLEQLAQIEFLP